MHLSEAVEGFFLNDVIFRTHTNGYTKILSIDDVAVRRSQSVRAAFATTEM